MSHIERRSITSVAVNEAVMCNSQWRRRYRQHELSTKHSQMVYGITLSALVDHATLSGFHFCNCISLSYVLPISTSVQTDSDVVSPPIDRPTTDWTRAQGHTHNERCDYTIALCRWSFIQRSVRLWIGLQATVEQLLSKLTGNELDWGVYRIGWDNNIINMCSKK